MEKFVGLIFKELKWDQSIMYRSVNMGIGKIPLLFSGIASVRG